jgi:hypothetical protein
MCVKCLNNEAPPRDYDFDNWVFYGAIPSYCLSAGVLSLKPDTSLPVDVDVPYDAVSATFQIVSSYSETFDITDTNCGPVICTLTINDPSLVFFNNPFRSDLAISMRTDIEAGYEITIDIYDCRIDNYAST